jgi:hypothetical protein
LALAYLAGQEQASCVEQVQETQHVMAKQCAAQVGFCWDTLKGRLGDG